MPPQSKLEKVNGLLNRALHPETPEPEARTCAWLAVKLIGEYGGLEKFSSEDRIEKRLVALERKYETSMRRFTTQTERTRNELVAARRDRAIAQRERAMAQRERNRLKNKLAEVKDLLDEIDEEPWFDD